MSFIHILYEVYCVILRYYTILYNLIITKFDHHNRFNKITYNLAYELRIDTKDIYIII